MKIVYTQEANEECENFIYQKSNFIDSGGSNIRKVSKEAYQAFFVLTKDPWGTYKPLTDEEKKYFCNINPEDITFSKLVEWFGNTVSISNGTRDTHTKHSKFNVCDTVTLYPSDWKFIKDSKGVKTTLGRLIFNKVLIERNHFENIFEYQNKVLKAGDSGKFDATVAAALKEDIITTKAMIQYINVRDWFGLQLHGVITSSFSPGVLKTPAGVKKMKKKLFDENKEAITAGDNRVVEKIEKQLIAETQKELEGDIGMDLYNSGARGSVGNHLKNILISRGAVANPVTGKYDIIENSLLDGLDKKDITPHSNTIVTGAYPKSVGTQVSGYLAKQILSSHQSEVLGPDGCDCGSNKYIDVTITEKNSKDYEYRYIKGSNGLILLTPDVIKKYIGKTVKMRSVMYCKTVGKEGYICSKCAGEFYYKLGKLNIGLICKTPLAELTQLSLQKFHQNVIKSHEINVDEIFL